MSYRNGITPIESYSKDGIGSLNPVRWFGNFTTEIGGTVSQFDSGIFFIPEFKKSPTTS